jgi:23S rRNA (guanosine2251-2'-O)-methyltransferase
MKKFKKPEFRGRGAPRPGPRPPPAARPNAPVGRAVIGIHAVEELLKVRPKKVEQFWLREGFEDHPPLLALSEDAKRLGVRAQTKPNGVLDKVASMHQGVIAFTQEEPELDWKALETAKTATLVALDEVEDPHNLGAVLRTCWLLGAQAVLTPEHRAAQLSPAVSKVAQGAVEHIPVVSDGALPQQLEAFKKQGFWIMGLSHKATQDIYTLDIPQKVVWVLGSESSGLRKSVEGVCDDLISIPQSAPNASYNVSVAAAIALGETYRQRLLTSGELPHEEDNE